MPKNILILSDGTGQAGGLRPDENRSSIYKLYRATRCGPDTAIDPREAVKKVYQHAGSPKDTAFVEQRKALGLRFRERYGCDSDGAPSTVPCFIGVFDTVAALGIYLLPGALLAGMAAVLLAISYIQSFFLFPFLPPFQWMLGAAAVATALGYVATHVKYAFGLEGHPFLRTLYLVSPKMKLYDLHPSNAAWYARHAMSINENRADFARVPWGSSHNTGPVRLEKYPDWLQQIWFAGNHSDVGGSYPENEARLSDIALGWMIHAAKNLPDGKTPDGFGIKVDDRYMMLHPDPLGPQHHERARLLRGPAQVDGRSAGNTTGGPSASVGLRAARRRLRAALLREGALSPRTCYGISSLRSISGKIQSAAKNGSFPRRDDHRDGDRHRDLSTPRPRRSEKLPQTKTQTKRKF
jgi:hypothetical protein